MRKKEEKPNRKKLDDKKFAIQVCNCYLGIPETIKDCAEESRISERNDYSGITMKKVAKMNGISEEDVRTCIYNASTKNWITYQMVWRIMRKEHAMQSQADAETPSDRYFKRKVLPVRRKNIRDSLTEEFCESVITTCKQKYKEKPDCPNINIFCGLSLLELKDTIIKGYICGYISKEDFDIIKDHLFWKEDYLIKDIEEYRENYKECSRIIEEQNRILESFDDVFSDSDDAPSKQGFLEKLEDAQANLETIHFFTEGWENWYN